MKFTPVLFKLTHTFLNFQFLTAALHHKHVIHVHNSFLAKSLCRYFRLLAQIVKTFYFTAVYLTNMTKYHTILDCFFFSVNFLRI
jgi:hypothetical protein